MELWFFNFKKIPLRLSVLKENIKICRMVDATLPKEELNVLRFFILFLTQHWIHWIPVELNGFQIYFSAKKTILKRPFWKRNIGLALMVSTNFIHTNIRMILIKYHKLEHDCISWEDFYTVFPMYFECYFFLLLA